MFYVFALYKCTFTYLLTYLLRLIAETDARSVGDSHPSRTCCVQVSAADDGNTSAVLQRLGAPVGRLGNVTSLYVVPNIVHFIWFTDNAAKQLTFINYISIVSAHRIQKPDRILLHCNRLPAGQWWERLWKEVERVWMRELVNYPVGVDF